MADRVTIVGAGPDDTASVVGELVDLAPSTIRVRLGEGVELPGDGNRYVVVVHREPAVFVVADMIGGETDEQVVRFARVARGE